MNSLVKSAFVQLISLSLVFVSFGTSTAKTADVEGKEVVYNAGGLLMRGYIAFDKNRKGRRPGVLVVPEWWGITDYERHRARMLAEKGYTALAIDMYGEGKQALNPDEAAGYSRGVAQRPEVEKERFMAAMDFLRQQPEVAPSRIAAIGYCFGGGVVLNMAGQGVDLKGVASFHGSLGAVKPARRGDVKARILVLQGTGDKFVSADQIQAFRQQLISADADFRIVLYPGASHAFTNPKADEYAKKFHLPIAYDAEADNKSWRELLVFLQEIFRE